MTKKSFSDPEQIKQIRSAADEMIGTTLLSPTNTSVPSQPQNHKTTSGGVGETTKPQVYKPTSTQVGKTVSKGIQVDKPTSPQTGKPPKKQKAKPISKQVGKSRSTQGEEATIPHVEKYTTHLRADTIKNIKLEAVMNEKKDYEVVQEAIDDYFKNK